MRELLEFLSSEPLCGYFLGVRRLLPLLIFVFSLQAHGFEWIELTDGTKVEGRILSVTADGVLMDVQTSPAIREERNFPRADVAKIQRAGKDDIAFAEVAGITVPATADDPGVYDVLLEQKVRPFMKNYAYSKHMPEARKLAATLEAERARVSAGELKVDGRWIGGGAVGPEKTEVTGQLQLSKMKAANDPAAAMMAFEVLEKNAGTSSSYPEGVRLARASLEKMRAVLVRARTDLDRRTREQEQGLQLASADRRMQMETGIAQEKASIATQVERARQTGGKWLPLLPDAKVLEELSKLTDTEDLRLAKVDADSMMAGVTAATGAREQIAAGRLPEAKASLDQAQKLWPQYVLLASLKDSLRKSEEDAAKKAKEPELTRKP